jgi:hypothetical protein
VAVVANDGLPAAVEHARRAARSRSSIVERNARRGDVHRDPAVRALRLDCESQRMIAPAVHLVGGDRILIPRSRWVGADDLDDAVDIDDGSVPSRAQSIVERQADGAQADERVGPTCDGWAALNECVERDLHPCPRPAVVTPTSKQVRSETPSCEMPSNRCVWRPMRPGVM